jgi:hypothetical protein
MKLVKPFIDRPFFPEEVDKIPDARRRTAVDTPMTNAILVGPTEQSKGELNEVQIKFLKFLILIGPLIIQLRYRETRHRYQPPNPPTSEL